ncbi:MAG: DUF6036 family nucleotidyltransferase [Ilumatobacteraceae bacterium]
MQLDKDFNEFVGLFITHDVRFLIVGGYALAAHGLPRATGDLDTWVWVGGQNPDRIVAALKDFGFGEVGISEDDFKQSDSIVQLGLPPYRIDILTSVDGLDFEQSWTNRVIVQIDNLDVPFISREDLIKNKRMVGRPQDLADVDRLMRG